MAVRSCLETPPCRVVTTLWVCPRGGCSSEVWPSCVTTPTSGPSSLSALLTKVRYQTLQPSLSALNISDDVEVSLDCHAVTIRPFNAPSSETFSPWEPTCPGSKVRGERSQYQVLILSVSRRPPGPGTVLAGSLASRGLQEILQISGPHQQPERCQEPQAEGKSVKT